MSGCVVQNIVVYQRSNAQPTTTPKRKASADLDNETIDILTGIEMDHANQDQHQVHARPDTESIAPAPVKQS
jgi:hypothetical protein